MINVTQNRNTSIMNNIISTLQQTKDSNVVNKSITIDNQSNNYSGPTIVYTVDFYVDVTKLNLLFSDNSTDNPGHFIINANGSVSYTPSDVGLNDNTTVSITESQSIYYLTVTSSIGLTLNTTYVNANNMVFQSVIVSSSPNPTFTINANQAILVPISEEQVNLQNSGLHGFIIVGYDLYVQQIIPNWNNLSEQERIASQQLIANQVRQSLYSDRYRGGNCTLFNKDINGTQVKSIKPLKSDTVLKGIIHIDCVYWTDNDDYRQQPPVIPVNYIQILTIPGLTLYFVIYNSSNQLFNTLTNMFENYNSSNWIHYAISFTYKGVGLYVGTLPSQIGIGSYTVVGYTQISGSPATTDTASYGESFTIEGNL